MKLPEGSGEEPLIQTYWYFHNITNEYLQELDEQTIHNTKQISPPNKFAANSF